MIYDAQKKIFYNYLQKPKSDADWEYKSGLLGRAVDMQAVVAQLKIINTNNKVLKNKINFNKIYLSGHSYGGHTAFYSTRLKFDFPIAGYINIDGNFYPDDDITTYEKIDNQKIYLLCVNGNEVIDSPKICDFFHEEFTSHFYEQEWEKLFFKNMTGWASSIHTDFGNFGYMEEIFSNFDMDGTRSKRVSSQNLWSKTADWFYSIVFP